MKNKLRGSICIATAVIIWGSAFIPQSVSMDLIDPFTFLFFRNSLAVAFLVLLATAFDIGKCSMRESAAKWQDPRLWKAGFLCGLGLCMGTTLQQMGLVYSDAGKAGFITAMYIVLVPVLGLFLKRKPTKGAVAGIILAVIGLYLLSCVGVTQVNKGDLLLMGCALGFAIQILCVDLWGEGVDGIRLNCVQSFVVVVFSLVMMLTTETVVMADVKAAFGSIAYAGILSSGIAFSLQIIGQKDLDPTAASIIMSMESVVAVICGAIILKETMTFWEISGCCLMFIAVTLAQLPEKKKS
ncbi:MAG: DMT family transporter [Oscillospiraceae bacterium]|nr:DMT family transporter [Oscillospiraceae bacterium]